MLWFEKNPDLLQYIREELRREYPTLCVIDINNKIFIRGSLFIADPETKQEIDRFGIELELPDNYPVSMPYVREIEGRIPKIIDRHINSNGTACLFFRDEEHKYYNKNTSIIEFIQIPVYNFFLSQAYFELKNKWLFGERHHGPAAVWEYYAEELETDDIDSIGRFLFLLASEKINVKLPCYCGSNKPLRFCHINKLLSLKKNIPLPFARSSFRVMADIKKKLEHAIHRR